ncbi:MAG: hypothetical protein IJ033_01390 [Clostridia bacterium]|nr:hypothetical protein [Clostridia bacterium]
MKRRYISVAIGLVVVILITIFGNLLKISKVEVEFSDAPVSVDAVEIYDFSTIKLGDSILSLNENVVKKRIMDSYSDNAIAVTDIVRVFPNKVIIYCQEHVPMCAIAKKGNPDVYAIADGDFQLNKVVAKADADLDALILIEGLEVGDTYNTATFKMLNKLFIALEDEGLDYAEQARFIKSIKYNVSNLTIVTRSGYTDTFSYTPETIDEAIRGFYQKYLTTP